MQEITLAQHREPASQTHGTLQHRILLVDGNEKQRGIFFGLLKHKLRYDLIETSSGSATLHYLKNNPQAIDLILLDLSTVDDGMILVSDIRALAPEIPIVVLVKYGDYQEAAEALLLGVQDFLTKPVAEERISVTLQNTILLSNARKEVHGMQKAYTAGGASPTDALISLVDSEGNARKIEEIEMATIHFAIRFYNGRMTEVARKLGIGRSTLYRKLGGYS